MALDMTPEQRAVGQANFDRVADGLTRRQLLKSLALTGGVVLPVSAALYFNYDARSMANKPVKTLLIGAGDEGGVLVGEHNPEFLEIVAVADIRPSNRDRIFTGDLDGGKPKKGSPRVGLLKKYGSNARQSIKVGDDYKKLLDENKDIEAVVIALPLHLHAPVTIECLKRGKHVLCEKLMAWNVRQCKEMIQAAGDSQILSIGHQRHYSLLYAHAQEVIKTGVLGDVHHIRALWHRNNALPKLDAQGNVLRKGEVIEYNDQWRKPIDKLDKDELEKDDAIRKKWDYKSVEELCRWRIYRRTGGGLMAELGSHQLDACSIFLGKVKPLAVTGVGGKYFYKDDRESEDHVFCTYEFPGKNYWERDEDGNPIQFGKVVDKNDRIIVTYSSISTNDFEQYGECVMGSKGTLVVEKEQSVQLYAKDRATTVGVTSGGGGKPALETSGSLADYGKVAGGLASGGGGGPVSRGYKEEMEHFAYCIRMWQEGKKTERPRCHGEVAMADAIIALTSNLAMETQKRIEFKKEWFDPAQLDKVPEALREATASS